ncbi:NAD(P)-binding protein [Lindgomyces ingoldianus]|uniref:NAD(P)-binding protein n=1 Tax=Lindgomyces ingoldianus TaxID=673940 RepID=A0ACB6QGE6_9PLEO|nr:NAD(P)-binding protein [Lindgomyces ingoldianus]KAF2465638.1 NAD(P)-binding protein [Lindgomyces ingoldianus]
MSISRLSILPRSSSRCASSTRPGRLSGKTALVTGSSSGLGRAIVKAYAYEGANVCCVDLYPHLRNATNPDTGKADHLYNRIVTGTPTHELLTHTHGGKHVFIKADLTRAEEVEGAVLSCVKEFGRLDIIVNNAGISIESTHLRPMRIHETDEADYDKTMAINTKAMFLGCKYAIREMLKQELLPDCIGDRGWIINTASIQGFVGYFGTPSYAASKGAAVMLTRQVALDQGFQRGVVLPALDYGKERIHCNALCPGFLKTAMTQNIQNEPETLRKINDAHVLGGMGDPDDVARVAVFLASDDARWVTGVPLPIDGGFLCQ